MCIRDSFMMVLMAKGFIVATPFIVRAISGNIVMPALTSGLGGTYAFSRAAMGSQQAYNRFLVGTATAPEYAALRSRQLLGFQNMPARGSMVPANNSVPTNSSPPSTGTAARMEAQKARAQRLADAKKS